MRVPGISTSVHFSPSNHQVVFCHAEVTCPQLAAAYEECFKRVVNSMGTEPYSACDKQASAMKKCLRRQGLHPIVRDTRH